MVSAEAALFAPSLITTPPPMNLPSDDDDGEEEGGVIFLPRCRLAFAFAFSVENKNKTKGFMSLRRKGSVILGTNYLTNIKGMTQICLAMGAEDL